MHTQREILLVEDNSDDEALTIRALKRNNIANQVRVAHDGVDALDYLFARNAYAGRDAAQLPVLVLLDINLPKLNGLQVLEEIRNHPQTKLLPVVMLTSSKEETDVLKSYNLHANNYIRKPVDFNEFVEAVRHLGIYWLAMNVPPCQE